jgi:hypothetical protein
VRVLCSVRYAVSASAEAPAEDNLATAMASFTDNPFAASTIVVAPAILTSASSTLCLGTNNRLGRVVDRTRVVSAQLAHLAPNGQNRAMCQRQLEALEVRWTLVLRALRFFYMSLGSFAAAALMSLFGSLFTVSALHLGFTAIALLGLLSGTLGLAGLVVGCAMIMQETRLAIQNLAEEVQRAAYT